MDGAFPSKQGQGFDNGGGYGRGGERRGFRGTAENAKTKLCTRWQAGDCRFGDRCNFAHGEDELRALPPRDDFGRGRGGFGAPRGGGYGGRGAPGAYGGGRGRGYEGYGAQAYGGGGYGGYPGYGAPEPHGYYAQPREPMPARAPEDPFARQGFPVNGPAGWVAYRTGEGEVYFHNFTTQVTQWERPVEWPNAPM